LTYKYYEYDDIVNLLSSSGFKVIEEYGYYDKKNIKDGDEMIFVCKKKIAGFPLDLVGLA
jgi:hypothetical protein